MSITLFLEKKKYKRPSQKDSSIQNTLLALAGQEAREREEKNPPPPPPGIPIENRTRNPYGAQFQSRPVDPSAMQAHAMVRNNLKSRRSL